MNIKGNTKLSKTLFGRRTSLLLWCSEKQSPSFLQWDLLKPAWKGIIVPVLFKVMDEIFQIFRSYIQGFKFQKQSDFQHTTGDYYQRN